MTHYELCKKTAEWALNKKLGKVILYEYQSFATSEFPDVLCFGDTTTLFEIKVDYQDFKRDPLKDCRVKHTIRYFGALRYEKEKVRKVLFEHPQIKELIKEKPHLGRYRYYVCPWGLIPREELPMGWGLYYFKKDKYFLQRRSGSFRRDIHSEIRVLTHAFQKFSQISDANVLVKPYER